MRERPILFSGEMVRAILDGRKTVTRRALKMPHGYWETSPSGELIPVPVNCPYGQPGDQLWVRETCFINGPDKGSEVIYKADPLPNWEGEEADIRWRPSIHMPRWASRIQLEITAVRVERLQDISEEQAQAEGAPPLTVKLKKLATRAYRMGFVDLWCRINGDESWDANPWVWVVEFKVIKGAQHG